MGPAAPESLRTQVQRYTPAQRRTAEAALDLFADHGVGGTSLQMIADSLGVTKAAVYHQFRTKDAIVVAVLELELARIEHAVEAAEEAARTADGPDRAAARDALLADLVEVVVGNRRALRTLQHDPVLFRLIEEHAPARHLFARMFSSLLGDGLDPTTRVRAAVLSAAIGAVGHPFVDDLDDDTLRTELLSVTRRLIE